jgi:hypothetical protein
MLQPDRLIQGAVAGDEQGLRSVPVHNDDLCTAWLLGGRFEKNKLQSNRHVVWYAPPELRRPLF